MIFRSQLRRATIANWFLMLIPDAIISLGIAHWTGSGIAGAALWFAAILAYGFIRWFLGSMVGWAAWSRFSKSVAEQAFLDHLGANRYPSPGDYEESAADYFVSVMNNKDVDPKLRVTAAVEVGTFGAYSGGLELQMLAKLKLAAEAAIARYRRQLDGLARQNAG